MDMRGAADIDSGRWATAGDGEALVGSAGAMVSALVPGTALVSASECADASASVAAEPAGTTASPSASVTLLSATMPTVSMALAPSAASSSSSSSSYGTNVLFVSDS